MATYSITECAICFEPYKNPRCLPCIHTFCLECIVKYGQGKSPGDEMTCPTCRQKFIIPLDGLDKLQKNYLIEQLLEKKNCLKSGSNSHEVLCDWCIDVDEEDVARVTASGFCAECDQNLCKSCTMRHSKLKSCQTLKVVAVSEKQNVKASVVKAQSKYCQIHGDKQLDIFCMDCQQLACTACYIGQHNSHKCCHPNEAAEKFKVQFKEEVSKFSHHIDVIKRSLSVSSQ